MKSMRTLVATLSVIFVAATAASGTSGTDLDRCLVAQGLPRVARVVAPDGSTRYARVVADRDGVPTRVAPIETGDGQLAGILARAAALPTDARVWEIEDAATQICAPFPLRIAEIDAEERVVVAAGLNYAAHAEEAGGGDTFLFPKPVAPTPPYGVVAPPAGVKLLDYEVELGLVLLADVNLRDLPEEEELLAISAFFVANEVTDREPIITHAKFDGTSDGFVEAKGQPGFLPAGPWLVHGPALGRALFACGVDGLGIRLEVDEGSGFETRQDANTDLMLEEPLELLAHIARDVEENGLRSPMPVDRDGETRHYPLAVDAAAPRLPAGSLIITGTPEGVALDTPDPAGLVLRGALRLRGPFEQYRQEQLARVASGEPGGFLAPGDRVRASIDGLGAQTLRIATSGTPNPDPCKGP
jgi:2-keto-4-pentenoate hydratase/2-oxohepta-3-ene-1,7-dioic acid hydratase in catechol pathway